MLMTGIFLVSCSNNAYQNAVPKDCVALAVVDMESLAAQGGCDNQKLASWLQVNDVEQSGLDFSVPFYLFESREGDFGFCAKVGDADALKKWMGGEMTKKGKCKVREGRKGLGFAEWNGSWLMGYSDDALLVMGPVLPAAMPQLQQRMARLLTQDEDKGLKGSRLTEVLDSMSAPVRVVSRLSALPPAVTMPFAFGVPKSAGENDPYLSASWTIKDKSLVVRGATFSFKEKVDGEIRRAQQQLRPVGTRFLSSVSDSSAVSFFANVEGESFLSLIHTNKGLETLLTGANMAIDMDNIIRSMQGDVAAVYLPSKRTDGGFALAAQLKNTDFLKDVGYWKSSCPKGTRIEDLGSSAFHFTGGDHELFFGVEEGNVFYAGSSEPLSRSLLRKAAVPLTTEVTAEVEGKPLALCLKVGAFADSMPDETAMVVSLFEALFGDIAQVIFVLQR